VSAARRGWSAAACVAMLSCGAPEANVSAPTEAARPAADGPWTEAERATLASLRRLERLPPDPTNRWADDAAAAAFGRALFYDAGLSPSGQVSCATCHDPARHFTDGKVRAQALGTTARHAPGIEGSQLGPWFFWDGRADSLWAQATGPIESAVEMGSDRVFVAREIARRYREAYERIFGPTLGPLPPLDDAARFPAHARPDADAAHPSAVAWAGMAPADQEAVTRVFVGAAKAIAAYERTLLPREAPFDRYVDAVLAGDASGGGHLTPEAVTGLQFFVREGACVSCHLGPFFTDRAFHNLGLPAPTTEAGAGGQGAYDMGRTVGAEQVRNAEFRCSGPWSDTATCEELRFLNPAFSDFITAFKTPSLRNVTRTAPYMHTGQFATLDDVLDFYAALPGKAAFGHRELTLQPLTLPPERRAALKAFLAALESPVSDEGPVAARGTPSAPGAR
jgi:cytochrome c peroxidase